MIHSDANTAPSPGPSSALLVELLVPVKEVEVEAAAQEGATLW